MIDRPTYEATVAQMTVASTGFIPGATIGAVGGATSGFVLNTGNSLMDGERFGGALQSGLMGGLTPSNYNLGNTIKSMWLY